MPWLSHPLQFVLVALAGWINQQQRDVIDYLQEENRVLRAAWSETPALHERSASPARREGPDARPTGVARVRLGCDAGHLAGVAPNPHRRAVRRQYPSWSGTAADHGREPRVDRAHGHREPQLGLHADPRRLGEPPSRGVPRDDRQRPPRTRPRARPRPPQENELDRVPQAQWEVLAAADFFTVDVWTHRG